MRFDKGGLRAAFFFLPFTLAVLGAGVPFLCVLGALRTAAFAGAAAWLWRRRNDPVSGSAHSAAVVSFAVLAIGHAFSSVYVWASLQHGLNIAMAAVLLFWAAARFRGSAGEPGELPLTEWFGALAAIEVAVAIGQRLGGASSRPEGSFGNPVFLSEFLAMAALLLAARALWVEDAKRLRGLAWGAGAVLLLASALSLTWSRGVAVALVPALGTLVLLRFGVSRGVKAFLFIGLPLLAAAGWYSASRFFAADIYNYGRWVFWRVALRIFADHPFGVGLGGYKFFWFREQEPFPEAFRHYAKFAQSPHNEYLEVLVGLGILGLLFFLFSIVPPMAVAAWRWKEIPESRRGLAAGAFSALVLTGVQALFNFNFHEAGIYCAGALLLGALLGCLPERSLGRPVPLPAWLPRAGALACLLLSAASLSLLAGTAAFERGMSAVRGGDLRSAERTLLAASALDPYRSAIPDALSAISFRRYRIAAQKKEADAPKHLRESIRRLVRARELSPMEPSYPQRLAMLHWEVYRTTGSPAALEASLSCFDDTLRNNPYRVEALWEKAWVLREVGRDGEADAALLRAVSIEPNFCRAYAKLAESSKGKDEERSLAWETRAARCRETARGRALEDNERWLVAEPGDSPEAE